MRTRGSDRRRSAAHICTAALALTLVAVWADRARIAELDGDYTLVVLAFALSAAVCALRAPGGANPRRWQAMSAGIACWALGTLLYDVVPVDRVQSFPEPHDLLWLAFFIPSTGVAVFAFRARRDRQIAWTDGAAVTAALGSVAVALLLSPGAGPDTPQLAGNGAFALGHMAVLSLLAAVHFGRPRDLPPGIGWMTAGFIVLAISDTLLATRQSLGLEDTQPFYEVGWPTAMAVIALGAGRCWKDRADEDPDPPRLVAALLPATVLAALAVAHFGPGEAVPAAGALAVAAAAAVIWRSYQSSLELRRLTEDTRRHERRFRAIFEHAHEAILLADDDRRYLAANPAACELLGRDEGEIVGRRIEDVSEAPREVVIQMWEDFKTLGADAMEYSLLRRDGARRFVHYSAVAGIEPGVHLAVLRDITARHEAEKRLRRSEAQLQAAQRLSHVGSWEMFADATTARWSREMCRIHGIEPTDEDLPRDLAMSFWHPGDRDMLERLWVEFEAGADLEEEDEFRYRIIRPDGEERVIAATCTRETDVDGREILRGTCMDVTERVQASEQAERLRAELDSARRLDALGRLAGGVAHDFNNLLSVIIARAHFASRALGDHPAAADVTEILGTADRAAKLVSQLMLFGGADRGEAEPVTLGALLGELQPLLQRLAGPGARLHLDVPEHEGLAVRADRTKLEQVAVNLITNARDAVGEDGDIHVSVRELPGWQVELRVRDDGVGMPPEVVAAIFEPFFTTKRSAGGTGLGLSVVYGIVTDAGGTITVDSRPGEGTTFHVVLPAERHVEQVALEEPGGRAGGAAVSRAPREETVLVVDDEDGVLEVAARALTDAGWRVIKANDGNTALREAARERVDVLLSDVVMPGMSGVQLARELRHRIPGLPVILMTGHASGSEDLRVGDAQVTKPFTPGDLVAAMDEVLEVVR